MKRYGRARINEGDGLGDDGQPARINRWADGEPDYANMGPDDEADDIDALEAELAADELEEERLEDLADFYETSADVMRVVEELDQTVVQRFGMDGAIRAAEQALADEGPLFPEDEDDPIDDDDLEGRDALDAMGGAEFPDPRHPWLEDEELDEELDAELDEDEEGLD